MEEDRQNRSDCIALFCFSVRNPEKSSENNNSMLYISTTYVNASVGRVSRLDKLNRQLINAIT